jgi:flagellar motor switch protein FliN/FliY
MSEKWISDDELKNLLNENSQDDLLDELLGGMDSETKEEVRNEGKTEEDENEDDENIFYDQPGQTVEVKSVNLEEFLETNSKAEKMGPNFETLYDVPVEVRVLLGTAEMTIEEILELEVESVVKLQKLAGEPVEIVIGDQIVAKGEIVIIDERFGVLITEIVPPRERIKTVEKKLRK